jgi:hypothetical protein
LKHQDLVHTRTHTHNHTPTPSHTHTRLHRAPSRSTVIPISPPRTYSFCHQTQGAALHFSVRNENKNKGEKKKKSEKKEENNASEPPGANVWVCSSLVFHIFFDLLVRAHRWSGESWRPFFPF